MPDGALVACVVSRYLVLTYLGTLYLHTLVPCTYILWYLVLTYFGSLYIPDVL